MNIIVLHLTFFLKVFLFYIKIICQKLIKMILLNNKKTKIKLKLFNGSDWRYFG